MTRFILSLITAAGLCHAGFAAPCITAQEVTAFQIVSLKSALMVGALSCGHQEQYDAFMTRFQPYILAEQRLIDHYFGRADGLYAQVQEDAYVTQLANDQSQQSLNLGANFCGANGQVFDQVLAMSGPAELVGLTMNNPQPTPPGMDVCDHRDVVASK